MSKPNLRRAFVAGGLVAATLLLPSAPAIAQSTGSSGSSGSGSSEPASPFPSVTGLRALSVATSQMGKPYLWGGTGPDAWDCSGLVQWAFRQVGVNLPRTTWEQAKVGQEIPLWALAPGDVLILNSDASHEGIYAGFGQVFNAYGRGVPVGFTPLSNWEIYTIRRF